MKFTFITKKKTSIKIVTSRKRCLHDNSLDVLSLVVRGVRQAVKVGYNSAEKFLEAKIVNQISEYIRLTKMSCITEWEDIALDI